MRKSIEAQSWLSVPPAPAWISRNASLWSASPEQRFDLQPRGGLAEALDGLLRVLDDRGIALGLAELDQLDVVLDLAVEVLDGLDLHVELIALAHDLAGLFRVGPEVRGFGAGGQVLEASFGCIPVKDASSAGSAPARFRRRLFRSRLAWMTRKWLLGLI